MNFLVNLMIICALCAFLFPPVISGSLIKKKIKEGKKILDNAAVKLADSTLKKFGFPEKREITEHVCHDYKGIDALYGDIVCHNAYETHFKNSELFKNSKLPKKAECMEITYEKKTADMAVCPYFIKKYPSARFLVANALKGKARSYYHFETENIQVPNPNVKFVHLRSISSKNWELSVREVKKYDELAVMEKVQIATGYLIEAKEYRKKEIEAELIKESAEFENHKKEKKLKEKNNDP